MRGNIYKIAFGALATLPLVGCAPNFDQPTPVTNQLSVTGPIQISAPTPDSLMPSNDSPVVAGAEGMDGYGTGLPFVRSQPVAVPPFPLVMNQTVQRYVDDYLNQPEGLRRSFARSRPYMAEMVAELRNHGLPPDLVYLTFAESAFSDTGAGPWQLNRGTARRFGLVINPWVDERRDPIKSTRAAATYLAALHDQEDSDWRMTLVAWNNGENGVSRYRHLRNASYDLLVRRLPHRTRELLNRFMAVAMIARHSREYGIQQATYEPEPSYRTVAVKGGTRLSALADYLHISVTMIRILNPGLLRAAVPPGRAYSVRVPAASRYLAAVSKPL